MKGTIWFRKLRYETVKTTRVMVVNIILIRTKSKKWICAIFSALSMVHSVLINRYFSQITAFASKEKMNQVVIQETKVSKLQTRKCQVPLQKSSRTILLPGI